jgi:hypothetical protein
VHEAAVVAGGASIGAGIEDGGDFLFEHGGGDVCILDGEGSAEAAALLEALEFDEVDSADGLEQTKRAIAEREAAEAVAACVVRDAMGIEGSDVLEPEATGEKFRELEDLGQEGFDIGREARIADGCGHFGIVFSHHRHAGRGGHDDDLGGFELVDEALEQGESFGLIAGVPMHLAAAGLAGGEVHGVAESLEDAYDSFPGGREKGVVVASDEERNSQAASVGKCVRQPDSIGGIFFYYAIQCSRKW